MNRVFSCDENAYDLYSASPLTPDEDSTMPVKRAHMDWVCSGSAYNLREVKDLLCPGPHTEYVEEPPCLDFGPFDSKISVLTSHSLLPLNGSIIASPTHLHLVCS